MSPCILRQFYAPLGSSTVPADGVFPPSFEIRRQADAVGWHVEESKGQGQRATCTFGTHRSLTEWLDALNYRLTIPVQSQDMCTVHSVDIWSLESTLCTLASLLCWYDCEFFSLERKGIGVQMTRVASECSNIPECLLSLLPQECVLFKSSSNSKLQLKSHLF